MNIYLIDYENVNESGLEGIRNLEASDQVHIFYSDQIKTIPFSRSIEMAQSPAKIEFIKTHKIAKNYLDFQLSTYLGYLIGIGTTAKIRVISKDTGFDSIVDFWKGRDIDISRQMAIEMKYEDDSAKEVKKPSRSRKRRPNNRRPQAVAEQAVTETTVAEQAVTEQAVAEQTVAEQTVTEQTVTEQTVSESTAAEQQAASGQIPEQTVAEPGVVEMAVAAEQTNAADQPVTAEQITESTVTDQSAVETTVAAEQTTVAEATVVEQPAAEVAEESAPAEKPKRGRGRQGRGRQSKAKKAAEAAPEVPEIAVEAPKAETPKAEAPKVEAPIAEAPKPEPAAAPAAEQPTAEPRKPLKSLPELYRKKVRAAVKEDQLPPSKYTLIYRCMLKCKDKLELNNTLVKALGNAQGGVVYGHIKPVFAEFKRTYE